jgi:ferric-dicitrate binding protein FerR (iron transport regulator)
MNCDQAKSDIVAFRSGNLAADESAAIARHLSECADCRVADREEQSALALFRSAGDFAPSDRVWGNIRSEIGSRPATRSFRTLLGVAAAAAILVAALSFAYMATMRPPTLAATVSVVAPDASDVRPGLRIATGETFRAPTYVVLALPDVGLLKLSRDTEIRFDTTTRVHLTRGDLFAEVSRGFVVESRDATVTVKGTRFGVSADGAPSTVYVVEGLVEVASKSGAIQLEAGRMAGVGGAASEIRPGVLEWIAQHETVMLSLEPGTPTLRQGESPAWRISFRTNSPAPMALEPLRELAERMGIEIVDPQNKKYGARLGPTLSGLDVHPSPNGDVRLDVMTPCILAWRVDPALFAAAGRYVVTLVYQGRQGVMRSDPIPIEVR